MIRTLDSVQNAGPRHARAEFHVGAQGAPPLPDQTNIGLPSSAAFCRASQRLVCHGMSIHLDSPGCGRMSLWVCGNFSFSTLLAQDCCGFSVPVLRTSSAVQVAPSAASRTITTIPIL